MHPAVQSAPSSPVAAQAPELTKLLQQKSLFQIQPSATPQKQQKSARLLRRRLSADGVLQRPNKSGRLRRRHSIKPTVQSKKRPIFILTDEEIRKNGCLSEPLGALSLFVSLIGVQSQSTGPRQPAWMGNNSQNSTHFAPPLPGPYQAIDDIFHYPQSNEPSPSCQYYNSNNNNNNPSFDFSNTGQWSDGYQYQQQVVDEMLPTAQTWPNTPDSGWDSGSDELSSIEPSPFYFDPNHSPFRDYDIMPENLII